MPPDTPPEPNDDELLPEDDDIFYIGQDVDEMYEIIDPDEEDINIEQDDCMLTFAQHKDAVLCCDFNSSGSAVVSGGQDETAFVWNPHTGEVIFECQDHTDSIISAGFNHDSRYIATGGMDGMVQVWDSQGGSNIEKFETSSEVTWVRWCHYKNELLAGNADGECWKWSIPDCNTMVCPSFGSSTSCSSITPNDALCVVGYEDGSVRFWDVDKASVVASLTGPVAHKGVVTTVTCHHDNRLALTSSTDGTAKLIKCHDGQILWTLEGTEDDSVESVGFFKTHPLIATGTVSGMLGIWDLSAQALRTTCDLKFAVVKLICDPASPLVYAASAAGSIQLFDGRTATAEREWLGHSATIFDFALSRDSSYLLSASEDKTCKVFKIASS